MFQQKSTHEKEVILLMIPKIEGWHYLVEKNNNNKYHRVRDHCYYIYR